MCHKHAVEVTQGAYEKALLAEAAGLADGVILRGPVGRGIGTGVGEDGDGIGARKRRCEEESGENRGPHRKSAAHRAARSPVEDAKTIGRRQVLAKRGQSCGCAHGPP